MKRSLQAIVLGCLVLLSACGKAPKHTRYIPSDATFVVGVSTEELGKKVGWSTISGSPMMQEMLKGMTDQKDKDAVAGLDKCGIEWMSTIYAFGRADENYSGKTQIAMVAPMKDAKAFEAYLKKAKPELVIKTVKDRKEGVEKDVYYAWNDNVLILSSLAQNDNYESDAAGTATDIDALFSLSKDASMLSNKRFEAMGNDKHDIVALMNYESLMNSNATGMGMMGMAMTPMYKGAYVSMGFDFNQGRVDGLMSYYPGPEMQEVTSKMASGNVDDKMLKRLPGSNVNGVIGYHISPAGLKMLLDKMNLTGMANAELQKEGLTVDDLLKATTGDIVLSATNLSVHPVTQTFEGMDGPETYTSNEPDLDVVMAARIGDRASLNKVVALLTKNGMPQSAANTYTIPMGNQTGTVMLGEEFIVASNRLPLVQGYMAGNINPALSGDALKEVNGHPAGVYIDVQSIMAPFASDMRGSDSSMYSEVRKLVKRFTAHGGEYKSNATSYSMSLEMVNDKENSLVQIINLANRMTEMNRQKRQEVVLR